MLMDTKEISILQIFIIVMDIVTHLQNLEKIKTEFGFQKLRLCLMETQDTD